MIAAGVVATAIVAGVIGWSKRKSKEDSNGNRYQSI